MKTNILSVAALGLLLLTASSAAAHHLWIEPSNGNWAVIRGMIPERIDAYDPACIREITAFDRNGGMIDVNRIDEDNRVIFTAGKNIALATVRSEWGYRVNTTRGKRLITRAQAEAKGLHVLSAFFSTHYAKSLLASSKAAVSPTGLRFEIVPNVDPRQAKPGDKIALTVLFDGTPLTGASLYAENGGEWTTDENGTALAVVPDNRTVLFYARHRLDVSGDSKKDHEMHTTFLSFEVNR